MIEDERDRLAAAEGDYLARGWHVLPVWPPVPGGGVCSCPLGDGCPSPGKHPLLRDGLKGASADPEEVAARRRRWPHANIGIRTGEASGVLVLDVDGTEGAASLAGLRDEHGPLPMTPVVLTGRGWQHYWLYPPDGRRIGCSAGRLGPGLDLRGEGGYVVAPPSLHVTGRRYAWQVGLEERPLRRPPEWFHEPRVVLASDGRLRRRPPRRVWNDYGDGSAYGLAALARQLERLRGAQEGARNDELNRAAFALGQLVGGGELRESSIVAILEAEGLALGLEAREVPRTVRSGIDAGKDDPRSAQAAKAAARAC